VLKESEALIGRPHKEYGLLMLKRLSDEFQGRVFKGQVRERIAGYVISLCMIL